MIICSLCKKEFKDRRSFCVHVNTTESKKFNSKLDIERFVVYTIYGKDVVDLKIKDYADKKLCCDDLKKESIDIIKYLKLLGIKRSSKEERSTDRYKIKYKSSIVEKYGVENISQSDTIKDRVKKTISNKHSSYDEYRQLQLKKLRNGFNEYKTDLEKIAKTAKKCKETINKKYGVENVSQIDHVRVKNSKNKKNKFSKMSYEDKLIATNEARKAVCNRGGSESKIERRIHHCLVDLGIDFTKHVHLFNYNYDILILDNLLIEVQGDMWHGNPLKYKSTDVIMGKILVSDLWKKDQSKKFIAENNGYKVIYIWESEIKKCNKLELVELVKEKILEKCND